MTAAKPEVDPEGMLLAVLEHIDRMLAGDAYLAAHEALRQLRALFVLSARQVDEVETQLAQIELRRAWALFIVLGLSRGRTWGEGELDRLQGELARADADSLNEMARIAYGVDLAGGQ